MTTCTVEISMRLKYLLGPVLVLATTLVNSKPCGRLLLVWGHPLLSWDIRP
jgi:hypothetical protein